MFLWQPASHFVVTFLALTETTPVDESLISYHVEVENSATEEEIVNPAVNNSIAESNEPVSPPVQVAKEDVNKAVVAHHPLPAAPTQTDVTKKSYASIVIYYPPSFPLLLHLMS
jgi:hypothetical protein